MADSPDAQVPQSASETEEQSSAAKENVLHADVEDEEDDEPEPRTPFQRFLWWTGFIAVDLEAFLVLAGVLKLIRWRGGLETWVFLGLAVVIGICWVLLQWSYGTLGAELKKFVTGNGKNFRSDSSLSPLAQVLVVVGVLLVGALGFYFFAWYVKH